MQINGSVYNIILYCLLLFGLNAMKLLYLIFVERARPLIQTDENRVLEPIRLSIFKSLSFKYVHWINWCKSSGIICRKKHVSSLKLEHRCSKCLFCLTLVNFCLRSKHFFFQLCCKETNFSSL